MRMRLRNFIARCVFVFWTTRLSTLVLEQAGTAGDVKMAYGASSAITVTNLQSLASSATWLAGWEGPVDNSTSLFPDYIINAAITVAAAGLTAGQIRMYVVAELDDSTWPDVFDGTEGTETVTDTEIRDSICKLIASTDTDTTASRVYPLMCSSLRQVLGNIPRKFVIFITHNTGAALASSGNAVYVKGVYSTVAL